jgi:two-component system CheB/CheR fusion protein
LFEAIDQGFYYARAIFDDEGRCVDIHYHDENSAAIRLTGRPAKGRLLSELGSYEDHWRDIFGRVARTGQAQRLEQFARADGLWYDFYVFRPAEAGPDEFAVVFRDITERRRAEEAIRASEERLRRIVENARDYAILTIDPDGVVEQWHQGAEAVFGWSAEEMIGRCADETFVPEDRDAGVPQQERDLARRNGSAPNIRWHARKDGSRVFIDGIVTALHGPGGEVSGFLKIGQDTTARRQAEEHQRFLLAELQHRVRNTLGVIRSIARRTAASSGSVEEMWAHLQGRIDAFSRVQAVVTRDPDAGVDLAALIEDELLAHAAREGKKLRIAGPAVTLKPQPAESLSLAIHELATNAVKYGALSSDRGRLAVRWSREGDDGDEQLVLTWQESGVDDVEPEPARQGFGLELLQRTLPYELDARTEVEFSAQGMRFSLRMPLSRHMLARAT